MTPSPDSSLFLLGTSHQVANLNERESIALPSDSIDSFYRGLQELDGLKECLVLNTCNRTEIYGAAEDNLKIEVVSNYLAEFRDLDPEFMIQKTYRRAGPEVVRHLFEVASGIDSQMVGETEILGQLKKAYDDASERAFTGKVLNRLFQKSLGCQMGPYQHRNIPWASEFGQCTLRISPADFWPSGSMSSIGSRSRRSGRRCLGSF